MTDVAGLNIEIPDELHRKAKSQAALEGKSLKDFVIAALEAAVTRSRRTK